MQDSRRRLLEIAIAGALTVCSGLLLLANAKKENSRNGLDRAVLHIASPLERVVSWAVSGVGSIGNRYFFLGDVEDENRELRAENERLRLELMAARQLAADTGALEALLDFKQRVPARTVGARVISGSLSPQYRLVRVRLDRGSEKLRSGMPVITGDGVVGRIETVVGGGSDVLLLTDPRSSIDVVLPKSGGRGVLTGAGTSDRYAANIEQIDRGVDIGEGDRVVTSGLGGAFPAGVEVGQVVRVEQSGSSLYQKVEVRPSVDFGSLDRVLILLTVPPTPEPRAEDAPRGQAPVAKRVKGL